MMDPGESISPDILILVGKKLWITFALVSKCLVTFAVEYVD
jgi:hypothetical protein